jgi:hypothetical protein
MRTVPSTIAIVSDCDDTLAPDTTAQLLEHFGVPARKFYAEQSSRLVVEGFDPALAYMNAMLELARDGGPLATLTRETMAQFARQLTFFPGVPAIFEELEAEVHERYGEHGIKLEEYVITGGLADLISASTLGQVVDRVWGCNFAYDGAGRIVGIKNVVSFTEKTRFLFDIEKGLAKRAGGGPYDVNRPMDADERPVPIKNMVYVGDGPSDIPCMSIITRFKGYVIGILSEPEPYKTWALGFGRRAHLTVPPEFGKDQHGYRQLRQAVIQIAENIKRNIEYHRQTGGDTPRY